MSKQSDLVGFTQGSVKLTVDANSTEEDVVLIQDSNDVDVASLRINNGAFIVKGKNASQPVQLQTHDGNEDIEVDPDGFIKMETAGAERMRIDSSGGVAVANTRPTTDFDIGGRNMVIGSGSGDQGITIYSSSAGAGNIWFADGGGATEEIVGGITYDHSGNFLKIKTNNSERMRIDSSGNVLINTTTIVDANGAQLVNNYAYPKTGAEFRSNATSTHSAFIFRNPNGAVGAINTSGSSTSYNTSSDYRLKENVTPLEGAADRLAQIPVHRFNFIADPDTTVDGFLAHEVQAFVPEAITGEHDGVDADGNPVYQGIDQSKLVPLLTAALQEALQKIDALEARVAALEAV